MAVRRKAKEVEEPTDMVEVTAEEYVEDDDWDGTVEEMPAAESSENDDVVEVPKRRGRAPLTLPAAAARFEKAQAALARLATLDVESERAKIQRQMERLTERLAKLDGHETDLKAAGEELAAAEGAFNAAVAAVKGD